MKYNDMTDKYIYRSIDTTMCHFMIEFIEKLKTGMYMRDMMNIVLEPFGIFQVNISFFFCFDFIMKLFILDSSSERYE